MLFQHLVARRDRYLILRHPTTKRAPTVARKTNARIRIHRVAGWRFGGVPICSQFFHITIPVDLREHSVLGWRLEYLKSYDPTPVVFAFLVRADFRLVGAARGRASKHTEFD